MIFYSNDNTASPVLHITVFASLFLFCSLIVIAVICRVSVVSRGDGRVVPVERVKVVQTEYLGIVEEINVRNGDEVNKGDVLVKFDSTVASEKLDTILKEKEVLKIEKAQIAALVGGIGEDFRTQSFLDRSMQRFLSEVNQYDQVHVAESKQVLQAIVNDLISTLGQIDDKSLIMRNSEKVTSSKIKGAKLQLNFLSDRLEIRKRLLDKNIASRSSWIELQNEANKLQYELEAYQYDLKQKEAERAALKSERKNVIAGVLADLVKRKAAITSRLATLNVQEKTARRHVEAMTVVAPSSGKIDQLAIHTLGGVSESGGELMRIVPITGRLEIEAQFSNTDIGFLRIGQKANIHLDAFPSERFGFILGKVSDVSPDSYRKDDGTWSFSARVDLKDNNLMVGPNPLSIRPGMTAKIDVITEERRIISYFFAPVIHAFQNALGEQ